MARRGSIAVATVALMLSACGGGEGPDDSAGSPPSDAPPSDSSPSESSPTEPAPSSEPTEETPAVEPADGPVLQVGSYSVSAPARFRVNNDTTFADSAIGPVGDGRTGGVVLGAYEADQVSLDEAMRRSWRPDNTKPPGFEKQPTTVLGSRTAYYYTAKDGSTVTDHVIGAWDGGGLVELRIDLPNAMPLARQREIVESVRMTYDPAS